LLFIHLSKYSLFIYIYLLILKYFMCLDSVSCLCRFLNVCYSVLEN